VDRSGGAAPASVRSGVAGNHGSAGRMGVRPDPWSTKAGSGQSGSRTVVHGRTSGIASESARTSLQTIISTCGSLTRKAFMPMHAAAQSAREWRAASKSNIMMSLAYFVCSSDRLLPWSVRSWPSYPWHPSLSQPASGVAVDRASLDPPCRAEVPRSNHCRTTG
jgi:hypothetical protein